MMEGWKLKKKAFCKVNRSLGIECKRMNEFNEKQELDALASTIKEVYFQDYKTAYDDDKSQRQIIDK